MNSDKYYAWQEKDLRMLMPTLGQHLKPDEAKVALKKIGETFSVYPKNVMAELFGAVDSAVQMGGKRRKTRRNRKASRKNH